MRTGQAAGHSDPVREHRNGPSLRRQQVLLIGRRVAYQIEILHKPWILELSVKDQSAGRGTRYEDYGRFRGVSNGIGPDLRSIFRRDKLAGVHDSG